MNRYDEVRTLIEANPEVAEFAEFGDGISQEWIEKAEQALGFSLPESYRWWSRNFGGGEIGGEEIFSIYCEDFDSVVGGDLVWMYRMQDGKRDLVPVCHSDIDGVFGFDLTGAPHGGEYPIKSEATGTVYAKDFLEFLKKRIASFSYPIDQSE